MQELDKGFAEIALDSIDDVFYVLSIPEGGKLVRWNKAFREKSGYSDEELKNMTVFDFFDDNGKQRQAEFFVGLLEKGQDIIEIEIITKKGENIPFEFHSTILKDSASDEPVAVIGIGRDSSQRRDEKKTISPLVLDLQERVKELGCLYEFSKTIETPDMTLERMINKLVTILPVAWQFPEITCSKIALGDNEYMEGNWGDVKAHQSASLMVNNQERGTVSVGYTEERPDDYEGPFLQEERTLLNAMTERLGRVIERIETRKALERSEEKYRDLYENAPNAYFSVGTDGLIRRCNERACEMLKYSKEELVGNPVFNLYADTPDGKEKAKGIFQRFKAGESIRNEELQMQKKDREIIWISLSVTPVKDEQGNVVESRSVVVDITERREAEKQYKLLAENITDVVWIMELDGFKRVYTSPSVERLRGFTPEEVAEAEPGSFVTPETMQNAYKVLEEELEKDKELGKADPNRTGAFEVEQMCKDGSTVWTEVTAKFLRDEEGNPTHILGVGRDVTDRKKYEDELKEAEEKFRTLAETLPQAVFEYDFEGNILYGNSKGFEMLGYERDDIDKFKLMDLLDPSDYVRVGRAVQKMLDGRSDGAVREYLFKRKDGSTFPGKAYTTLISNAEGERLGVRGILADITEEKEAERVLRESEMRYRDLFENANDLIQSVGSDMKFQYVNKAWKDTLGYTEEEAKELSLMDIIHPDSREHCMEAFKVVIDGGEVSGVQAQFVAKDGRAIDVEGNVSCHIEKGIPVATRGIFRDITERKKAEKEIQRINVELEGFAHTVSHDLRGPLTVITLASHNLREILKSPLTDETGLGIEELTEIIDSNVDKSGVLIEDLLTLAESGQEPREVSDVDVREAVKRVLEERKETIEERGVEVNVDDNLGHLRANSTQVYQLFSNLIDNAIKHNDSKEPVIEVSYLGDDERGAHRYLVRDNGSGIPPEELDKIYTPFYKGKTGGTGVGLSTVDKVIKVYGGKIRAYNDNGACFEFMLADYEK